MNQTVLTIGLAFAGGCLAGVGIMKGVELMSKKKRKFKDIYYYEANEVSEDDKVFEAVISENKLSDFLTALIDVTISDPVIHIEKLEEGLTRIVFEASYDQHLDILSRAGIEYKVEEA